MSENLVPKDARHTYAKSQLGGQGRDLHRIVQLKIEPYGTRYDFLLHAIHLSWSVQGPTLRWLTLEVHAVTVYTPREQCSIESALAFETR